MTMPPARTVRLTRDGPIVTVIIDREPNREYKNFYELLWHCGGSQSDVATLTADNIDLENGLLSYRRGKSKVEAVIRLGPSGLAVVQRLPKEGPLFPHLSTLSEANRADAFRHRCRSVGITGVTLHSYRYAFAERCAALGMERPWVKIVPIATEGLRATFAALRAAHGLSRISVVGGRTIASALLDAGRYREEWAAYEKSPAGRKRPGYDKRLAAWQDGPAASSEREVVPVRRLFEHAFGGLSETLSVDLDESTAAILRFIHRGVQRWKDA